MPEDLTQRVGDWKWHVWELHPKTGKPMKWIGQFFDHKGAFQWCDQQPRGRKGYRVNNVPPTTKITRPIGSTSIRATSPTKAVEVRDVDDFPVRIRDVAPPRSRPATVPVVQKPPKQRAKEDPNIKKVKEDAKVILDQHKADEQADIEAGRVESA